MSRWSDTELSGYISAAESGDVSSQMWLGWAYWEGLFIAPDLNQASLWLERGAATGDPEAAYRLALFLNTTANNDRVIALLEYSIDKCYAPAAYELGKYYSIGRIVEKSYDQMISSWERAVSLGHIPAEAHLLRARIARSPLMMRPLMRLKLLPIVVRAVRCHLRNPNDPRVVGAEIG